MRLGRRLGGAAGSWRAPWTNPVLGARGITALLQQSGSRRRNVGNVLHTFPAIPGNSLNFSVLGRTNVGNVFALLYYCVRARTREAGVLRSPRSQPLDQWDRSGTLGNVGRKGPRSLLLRRSRKTFPTFPCSPSRRAASGGPQLETIADARPSPPMSNTRSHPRGSFAEPGCCGQSPPVPAEAAAHYSELVEPAGADSECQRPHHCPTNTRQTAFAVGGDQSRRCCQESDTPIASACPMTAAQASELPMSSPARHTGSTIKRGTASGNGDEVCPIGMRSP